jgi:hypothetical protein
MNPDVCVRVHMSGVCYSLTVNPMTCVSSYTFPPLNPGHTSHDTPEDTVLVVQVVCALEQYEELAAVGVGAAVGHGQNAAPAVQQARVQFVLEGGAVHRLPTGSRARRVSTLSTHPSFVAGRL